ncbi:MAG: hypothetical protein RIC52_05040 [Amphiplicatus sp.]
MPDVIRLSAGNWEAAVAPAFGGSLLFLRRAGADILRSAISANAVAADPRNGACFPCVPYFGRLAGGLTVDGRRWPLDPTLPACDPANPLHGEGWVSPWRASAQTPSSLTIGFEHAPSPGRFPFPYRAEQTLTLDDKGLTVFLSIENTGAAPMPAGLGLHPYFARVDDTRLAFSAERYWTPPDGPLSALPDALGQGAGAPLPPSTRDHSYAGFGGAVAIESGGQRILLKSDAPALHLYAPGGRDYYCLEPVTHLPGAFTGDAKMSAARSLEPGERLSLTMFIGAA